jgi:hypothetical protein
MSNSRCGHSGDMMQDPRRHRQASKKKTRSSYLQQSSDQSSTMDREEGERERMGEKEKKIKLI